MSSADLIVLCDKCQGKCRASELNEHCLCEVCAGMQVQPAGQVEDPGQHYRHSYRVKVTQADLDRGYIDVKLDPFRIAKIYGMTSFALNTVLKKILKAGERGHKNYRQDLLDSRSAIDREIEILDEDEANA